MLASTIATMNNNILLVIRGAVLAGAGEDSSFTLLVPTASADM
jgi:hypothetical protein